MRRSGSTARSARFSPATSWCRTSAAARAKSPRSTRSALADHRGGGPSRSGHWAGADGWHYHGAWHGDIRHFDAGFWHGGHWWNRADAGRLGWWWIVGPNRYWYAEPVYPYPDPLYAAGRVPRLLVLVRVLSPILSLCRRLSHGDGARCRRGSLGRDRRGGFSVDTSLERGHPRGYPCPSATSTRCSSRRRSR